MKKIILITGASSGIGKATAIRLAQAGHLVYGAARNVEAIKAVAHYGVIPLRLDVTSEDERRAVAQRILTEHGVLDVLFNNAGFGAYGAIEDVDADRARRQFEVNVFGMMEMVRLFLPAMRERREGLIINTSSIAGKIESPMGGWYHASKHAVEALSDSLRLEVEPFGVDVVIVEPGLVRTNFYAMAGLHMLTVSGSGQYARPARSMLETFGKIMADSGLMAGSDPTEIAEVVERIVDDPRPDTRYTVGKLARVTLLSQSLLSDRAFDKLITRQMTPDTTL